MRGFGIFQLDKRIFHGVREIKERDLLLTFYAGVFFNRDQAVQPLYLRGIQVYPVLFAALTDKRKFHVSNYNR